MSGYLTTHVLDTARGCPAEGIKIALYKVSGNSHKKIAETVTNADGRTDTPILPAETFATGTFELIFFCGDYLRASGQAGEQALQRVSRAAVEIQMDVQEREGLGPQPAKRLGNQPHDVFQAIVERAEIRPNRITRDIGVHPFAAHGVPVRFRRRTAERIEQEQTFAAGRSFQQVSQ